MITIEFYRFVPTLKVVKLKKDHKFHNVFNVKLDHSDTNVIEQCPLTRARNLAKRWLDDHYGFVMIYVDNQDDYDSAQEFKICNHKKFYKDMHNMNFEVTVRGHNHALSHKK